ncbi:MAG: hypothetical protein SXV54_01250 [Chloroflexota bacterium]|nr:hypothetical protein [Chloroflexota bacterium]
MPKLVSVLRERASVGQDANKLALPYYWKHLGTVRPQNIERIRGVILLRGTAHIRQVRAG